VVLVEQGSGVAAGEAIVRILQDEAYRQELQKRSRRAQEQFFSWDAIAAAYATALNG
jgi:glycosyltransferase involved in cell wall biosynthesis